MGLPTPVVRQYGGLAVVRDDLLPGGTKVRALLPVVANTSADEFVYASPAYGYAQVALARVCGTLGRGCTIFTAKRKEPHFLTLEAKGAGAKIVMVPHGYLNVVQSRARAYCHLTGAYLLPFGADMPAASNAIESSAREIDADPPEVWSAAGSGTLTRALQKRWPDAKFHAVLVGKRNIDIGRAQGHLYPAPFERPAKRAAPFPSAVNYDAKAWEFASQMATPGALFWNVAA